MVSPVVFDGTHFGSTVRRYREAEGLSQRQLAKRAKIDPSYLCRIERGRRIPDLPVVISLAGVLGMDASLDLMDALVRDDEPVLAPAALDVARYMRDPDVSDAMKTAVSRSIEGMLRAR